MPPSTVDVIPNPVSLNPSLFSGDAGGLGTLFRATACGEVGDRLGTIEQQPLSRTELNQLLHLCHEAGLSEGFFQYYWLRTPQHTYDVCKLPGFLQTWIGTSAIVSKQHLLWGVYRACLDGLFYFGDMRTGYRELRAKSDDELAEFFREKSIETGAMQRRGSILPLVPIARDDRYLISEMACKSYGDPSHGTSDLKDLLFGALKAHQENSGGRVTIRKLLEQACAGKTAASRQQEFLFSADDILDEEVENREQLQGRYERVADKFQKSREAALQNTRYYLSMVNDLDVYVATSMRDREDFRRWPTSAIKSLMRRA